MLHYEVLDPTFRVAFELLLQQTWQQNWSGAIAEQIVHWRYFDRPPGALTWLAMDGDVCVGMLDSMLRPYLLDGQRIMVRETADWYCSPAYRKYGVGLWLLRKLRLYPEPLFVLGGSHYTLEILPKWHWTQLPSATSYIFPVKIRGLAANLIRQRWWTHERWARAVPNLPFKIPKRIAPPRGGRPHVQVLTDGKLNSPRPPVGEGLIQLFDQAHWEWLCRMPRDLAQPIGITFSLDSCLVGFSLSQIEPAASGLDARIMHIHTAPDLLEWVIAETIRVLADHDVGFIRCCVSTDDKIKAMETIGYIKSKEVPCHWLQLSAPATPGMIDVGYLRGDDAIPFQALRGRMGKV